MSLLWHHPPYVSVIYRFVEDSITVSGKNGVNALRGPTLRDALIAPTSSPFAEVCEATKRP